MNSSTPEMDMPSIFRQNLQYLLKEMELVSQDVESLKKNYSEQMDKAKIQSNQLKAIQKRMREESDDEDYEDISKSVRDRESLSNFSFDGRKIRLRKILTDDNKMWQRVVLNKEIKNGHAESFEVQVIQGYDFLVGVMREDSKVVQEDSKIANEMLFHFHSGEIWYFEDGDVAKQAYGDQMRSEIRLKIVVDRVNHHVYFTQDDLYKGKTLQKKQLKWQALEQKKQQSFFPCLQFQDKYSCLKLYIPDRKPILVKSQQMQISQDANSTQY